MKELAFDLHGMTDSEVTAFCEGVQMTLQQLGILVQYEETCADLSYYRVVLLDARESIR